MRNTILQKVSPSIFGAAILCAYYFTDAHASETAWTLGAHVGVPLGPALAAAAIVGRADAHGANGLLFLAEPGIGGGELAVGYADISGTRAGPYLVRKAHDWAGSDSFLWPHDGWSARAVLVRTWGEPWALDSDRLYAGGEAELIRSFAQDAPWGGLFGLNGCCGLVTNIDSVNRGDRRGSRTHDIRPGDEFALLLSVGIGF